ncbi:hypothetical protein QWY14_07880 [Planococcus sp. N028]|uniref:Glycosyltransferase family 4 protein n=1 Tax=Planococcus shixiaomingii TaxID=3058393 RepID=A0ABT8N1D6_9BACL|nr:hypothetical protein [Planococcus sp. N028]MDN7241709.1 hypothetical protein [Planococcus sp. N028]
MSEKEYPKILIINGGPIGEFSGTGVTLKNLFEHWPADKLLQICYCDSDTEVVEGSPSFEIFPKSTVLFDYFFRKFLTKIKKNQYSSVSVPMHNLEYRGNEKKIHKFVRAILDLSPVFLQSETLKAIERFKPDVIYSNLSTVRLIKTVKFISKKYNIKPVIHFMDDWPTTLYASNKYTIWAHYKMNRKLLDLLSLSEYSITISNLMAVEYKKRYKIDFTPIANPIVSEIRNSTKINEEGKKILAYCGGLHLGRWENLKIIGEEFDKINNFFPDWEIQLYTSKKDWDVFKDNFSGIQSIVWKKELMPSEVLAVLRGSELLIHVESFNSKIIEFTKYSFSTKIPQYMSSGKSIFTFGPKNLASTQYIENQKVGLLASNRKEIKEKLITLLNDPLYRKELGNNGLTKAKKEFSKNHLENELLKVLKKNC